MSSTLAIVNGRVWKRPGATAVLVDGERISAVGDDRFSADRVIDAGGLTILPAFNDAHVHFLTASRSLGELDLFGLETQAQIESRITEYARRHKGAWVVGRGWFYSAFPGGMPTVDLLDRLVPDRPAYLESFDAHTGWANSRALSMVGVATRDVLTEATMLGFVDAMPRRSKSEDLEALRAGMRVAAAKGIASVQEAGDGQNQIGLWTALRDSGELSIRVRLAFDLEPGTDISRYDGLRREDDRWVSTGILKAFADGVVESKTAAMLDLYEGSDEKGTAIWARHELATAVHQADERGWQIEIHAIGDAAVRQALDALEDMTPGRRHRIEHIETPDPRDIPRFATLGVIASMQPQHADPTITQAWRHQLGTDRASRGWPWKAIRNAGGRLAFGTDWPVVPLDPFASIRMAVTGGLTLEEAVDAWTSGSAYAEHMDHEKGEVREGCLADLTVVDLERATVALTVVGGRVVYES
ncbi:MAG TPA: amidohydrolase [Candidatus Dormibacteraeota bacterium]|nr:amidohydrolase [Candidatus Dormibacteraeota bacterium]